MAKFWCGRVVKGKVLAVDHEDSNIHVTRATVSNADKLKEGTRATLLCCLNTNAKTEVLLHGVLCPAAPLPARLPPAPAAPGRSALPRAVARCLCLPCAEAQGPWQVWTAVARFCIGREESSLIMLVVPLGESVKLKVCLVSVCARAHARTRTRTRTRARARARAHTHTHTFI